MFNTAEISDNRIASDAARFPFIAGLRSLQMDALYRPEDGAIGLIPAERATPEMMDIARVNKNAIIAEIEALMGSSPETAQAHRPRWWDPRHYETSALSDLMSRLFAYLSYLKAPQAAYWDGYPETQPARPYCYIKDVLVNGAYTYWPMLADTDGQDYVWTDFEQWDYEKWLTR